MQLLHASYQLPLRCGHSDNVVIYPGRLTILRDYMSLAVSARLLVDIIGLLAANQPGSWFDDIVFPEQRPNYPRVEIFLVSLVTPARLLVDVIGLLAANRPGSWCKRIAPEIRHLDCLLRDIFQVSRLVSA